MKKHLLFLFAALLPLVASAEKVEIDGIWYNLVSKAKQAEVTFKGDDPYQGGWYSDSITLPATVTRNGVAYSVASIGDAAFYGCTSLKSITIPEGVTSIGFAAFYECSNLTAINIPKSVTSIGEWAFYGCSSLKSITLPEGVTSIGYGTFYNCSSLTAINIPEGVTSIRERAFQNCSSLTAITIPEGVTSIENLTFLGCSSLTAITIPEGVKSIGNGAFDGCSLITITIPESVTSIGNWAFQYCSSLTAITCNAITPPIIGDSGTFNEVDKSIPLYVPAGSVEAYKSASYWSEFTNIQPKKLVTEIILNQTSATLTEGETISLTATVTPDDATDKSISWSSSNPSVATVDNTGKVTAVAPGTGPATITATANDGSGVSAQCEVTVTPASYVITVLVDGEVILTETLTRGSTINLPDVPEKEGYTFSGWGEVPETMPAKDVTVSGTFIINKYLVTFKIGDEVIAADSLEYGAAIVAPEVPEKEGYTFSGWSEFPETMPANDVTISGTFIVNKYLVTFKIGDEVIAADSLEYGAAIVVPEAPAKEGYTFSGWGEVAETVPDNDVTYSAYYIANVYKVYYFVGSKLVNMVKITYGEPIPEYIYEPTTEGDEFLGWIGETYATMPAHDVTYTANICSDINAMSTDKGQQTIVIYDLHGRRVTNPIKSGIYIVGGKKMMVK